MLLRLAGNGLYILVGVLGLFFLGRRCGLFNNFLKLGTLLLDLCSLGFFSFLLLAIALLLIGVGRDEILLLRQVGIGDARHLHGVA